MKSKKRSWKSILMNLPINLPEGNGFDEDYISDSSDGAMADCEDNGENLERGIISTTRDGKVANPDWYKSLVEADVKVPSVYSDMAASSEPASRLPPSAKPKFL
jgi:hypothetical protein